MMTYQMEQRFNNDVPVFGGKIGGTLPANLSTMIVVSVSIIICHPFKGVPLHILSEKIAKI